MAHLLDLLRSGFHGLEAHDFGANWSVGYHRNHVYARSRLPQYGQVLSRSLPAPALSSRHDEGAYLLQLMLPELAHREDAEAALPRAFGGDALAYFALCARVVQ